MLCEAYKSDISVGITRMSKAPNIDQHLQQMRNLIQSEMQKQGMNTAALANALTMDRKELKRILNGSIELTVRDLVRINMILSLDSVLMESPEFPVQPEENTSSSDETPQSFQLIDEEKQDWTPEILGNHTKQLIAYGFALGCDMLLICTTEKLNGSNVPKAVLDRYAPRMPIQLDAQFHQYNKPEYSDNGISLRLSFDALYTCFFSWDSIEQIIFKPQPPEQKSTREPPKLRLV